MVMLGGGGRMIGKGRRHFWGNGNIPFLDQDGGYRGVCFIIS